MRINHHFSFCKTRSYKWDSATIQRKIAFCYCFSHQVQIASESCRLRPVLQVLSQAELSVPEREQHDFLFAVAGL